jgi:NTP pyrophosphatase (non-canonical NTP hydrolase)
MDHDELVMKLCKPGYKIKSELSADDCHLIHMVMGISGEAGELLDAIKKHVIYQKPLDRENVIEEVGDILFYISGLLQALDIYQTTCVQHNMDKLKKRYASLSYSDSQAQERADKELGE